MIKQTIQLLLDGRTLSIDEAEKTMTSFMNGEVTDSQIASILTILRFREETVEEMIGFTMAMRKKMSRISYQQTNLVDTCGTGGDKASTFNISTAAAIVAASGGATVAKHGNRAFSSNTGSADVLEALRIPIQLDKQAAITRLNEKGMAFLFAPKFHTSMKNVALSRKEIGFRTIFNILGPLANPVACENQVIGVFSIDYARKMAKVLQYLGTNHVMIVSGRDGLDEISISSETDVIEIKDGTINEYIVSPLDFGMELSDIKEIQVKNTQQSASIIEDIFLGKTPESAINIVALNAGAALYVSGVKPTFESGIHFAKSLLQNRVALKKFLSLQEEEGQIYAGKNTGN
ncbi:anthranilate phosphoribosyltransferase [Bacillus sp. FJAT-45066]|uniref:anthranilate phosphoribosyltransferase n=1 Tax=Bacillus sp. FJAT-45066 TaxID=2011010 RepID=UPI000BB80390|nr:anthranilate phosphoribosyltransferase [Bacillus sp. FJAT-45066]